MRHRVNSLCLVILMRALTKDLIDNPDLWNLSMLIGNGGMDVFAHCVVGDGSVVSAHVDYDASVSSKASALEEAVYANPLLLMPFRKIDIVVACDKAVAVPDDVQPERMGQLLSVDSDTVLMESPLNSREKLIYALDRGIANFLNRTYDRTQPVHTLSVLCRYHQLRGQRNGSSRMFVNLGASSLDIVVFNSLGLAAVRHLDRASLDECAYWVVAIFRQCGLDSEYDEIIISGNSERRHSLMPMLSRFINNVMPAIFPSAVYHGDAAAMKAPFPLVILPLCEL